MHGSVWVDLGSVWGAFKEHLRSMLPGSRSIALPGFETITLPTG